MKLIRFLMSFIVILFAATTTVRAEEASDLPKDPPMHVGEQYDFTGVMCFEPDAILQYFDGPRIAIGAHDKLPANTVVKDFEAAQLSYQASECTVGHYTVTPIMQHQDVTMYTPTQQNVTPVCHYYLVEAISLHNERLVIWSRVPLEGARQSGDQETDLQNAKYVSPCDNYKPVSNK